MSTRIYIVSVQIPYNALERRLAKGHNVNPVTYKSNEQKMSFRNIKQQKKSQFDFNNGTE